MPSPHTIHKFRISTDIHDYVMMPVGSKVIHVGNDPENRRCVWAEVDTRQEMRKYDIRIVGTGHPLPDKAFKHLATLIEGPFVWHVYIKY